MDYTNLIAPINNFLYCATPDSWVNNALDNQELLLLDHANCEKKAASTAVKLINRYLDYPDLMHKMSRLAREELRHFEQVLAIMQQRNIQYSYITAASYGAKLHAAIAKHEPLKLIDSLILGAIIEARSCERFYKLAPHLDDELQSFYNSLLKSEARHYQDYLVLASDIAAKFGESERVEKSIAHLLTLETQLINTPTTEFRFHSGPLIEAS